MSAHDPVPNSQSAPAVHVERRAYVRVATDLVVSCRPTGRRARFRLDRTGP